MRLLVVSYPDSIENGVVEIIDYHLPPASFLTNLFGIKITERGGELSYVATIKSDYFTAPAGIVAVKDQPILLSEFDDHAIPSFYLTNTYSGSGILREFIEKGLKIARADLVFYNAKAEGALRVGFGLDRPHAVATDDTESGIRVYVSTQDGVVHLFEQFYIDSVFSFLMYLTLDRKTIVPRPNQRPPTSNSNAHASLSQHRNRSLPPHVSAILSLCNKLSCRRNCCITTPTRCPRRRHFRDWIT